MRKVGRSAKNAFSACRQYMIWRYRNILFLKVTPKKVGEVYMFYTLFTVEKLQQFGTVQNSLRQKNYVWRLNSKIFCFLIFFNFSFVIFLGQNVLIPMNHILLIYVHFSFLWYFFIFKSQLLVQTKNMSLNPLLEEFKNLQK